MEKFLEEILQERENRFLKQIELISLYKRPLITFGLNLPGKIKNSDEIKEFFWKNLNIIKCEIKKNNVRIVHEEFFSTDVGNFSILVVDFDDVKFLKNVFVNLEENLEHGRLLDIDVISKNFEKVSRIEINFDERKCLLCDNTANFCIKNRTHTYEELYEKAMEYIKKII